MVNFVLRTNKPKGKIDGAEGAFEIENFRKWLDHPKRNIKLILPKIY